MRKNRIYPKDKHGFIMWDSNDNPMTWGRYLLEEIYPEDKMYNLLNILNVILVYPFFKLIGYVSEVVGDNQFISNPTYWLLMLLCIVFIVSFFAAAIYLLGAAIILPWTFIKLSWIYTRVKFFILILISILESYLIYKFLSKEIIYSNPTHEFMIFVFGICSLVLLFHVIIEFSKDIKHNKNYQLTIAVETHLENNRLQDALSTFDKITLKEGKNSASESIVLYYLKCNDFDKAIDLAEKMNYGFDKIVNAYLKADNVAEAINFADKKDNDSIDSVVDYLNEKGRFSEAIDLNLKIKSTWDRAWNMEETAKKSALVGQTEITNKAIQQIIQYDKHKNSSYGDWKILYEVAIMLEEKSLYPEHVAKLLTSTKEHVLSFEDDYDKKASIENFNDEVDDSKMSDDSKKRFKELFKE
jgi:tetratricopeptide (TPR) repeat protein